MAALLLVLFFFKEREILRIGYVKWLHMCFRIQCYLHKVVFFSNKEVGVAC